ncbi:O-acetyl-ADP-ribose deacetylase [Haliea sp. E17]|uniref:O-acetyl-ADP-ribose deacetylase n=1 Tax=Haliea sp. E17 TaxID=3401576 RepID=UPI003AB0F216
MNNIKLQIGDITGAQVDAIINAANEVMLGGGGVDGAIHRAAGPELKAACQEVPAIDGIRCPTGEARITPAGKLPANYVIHTVGPVFRQSSQPAILLAAAYRNSLRLALEHDCRTVAAPAVSCGVYGYPVDQAARIALDTCAASEFAPLEITFYLFDQGVFDIWDTAYRQRP